VGSNKAEADKMEEWYQDDAVYKDTYHNTAALYDSSLAELLLPFQILVPPQL
jgi:hypothetical protein